ncbi:MAG: folylpolyglutamate synthase/dihydrofolate synthase family protein [Thermoplasmata archaeon]|nr:folylpolyglutamate synthase/dihydrofolate synthase family protein [Thermoplasmata archaeon]
MALGSNALWYGGLSRKGVKLGLDNEEELLERLGRPQDRIRFVHVAGTDGKGSVCAMMESVLREAGFRVGAFTSPEILAVNECIRIDGCEIEDRDFEQVMGVVREQAEAMAAEGRECTSFEVLTAAALVFFGTVSADIAVMEVGMGGRLDSTNVIMPEVTVINNVSLEHTAFLGGTIREISAEKAGIMKPGVPCVTMNPDDVYGVLESHARAVGCPIRRVMAEDVRVLENSPDSVQMEYGGVVHTVGLPGRHQARNAALAIEGLAMLPDFEERIAPVLSDGLADVSWPCRMQKLMADPIIVDVTHTVSGAECLSADIAEIYGDVVLVIGMLSDKDADGVSAELAKVASAVFVTQPDSPRARPAEDLASIVSEHVRVDGVHRSVAEAMEAAMEARGDANVLVTGSFRMAEGVLRWLQTRSSRYSTGSRGSTWAERILAATRRV